MQKVSLQDKDIDKTTRETYIESVAEKILKLPISELAKKVLELKTPFELRDFTLSKEERDVEKTILYQILDKGITGGPGCFSEWSKGFGVWNTFHESEGQTESEVTKYITSKKIAKEDIEQVLIEVNQYFEGFSFTFWVNDDQWHFGFSSDSFNQNMTEQMEKRFAV